MALIGWETLINQLGTLGSLTALSGFQLAFFASQLITAAAAATATVYLLRRRAWAVVLGVGVCLVRIVASIIGLVGLFGLGPDFSEDPSMATTVAYVILLTVPAMVGIWLLVDPVPARSSPLARHRGGAGRRRPPGRRRPGRRRPDAAPDAPGES